MSLPCLSWQRRAPQSGWRALCALSLLLPVAGVLAGPGAGGGGRLLSGPPGPGCTAWCWPPLRVAALCGAMALVLRCSLQRGRPSSGAGTWDCGYVKPDARMQYTASSFAQPLTGMFHAPAARAAGARIGACSRKRRAFPQRHRTSFRSASSARASRASAPRSPGCAWLQHGRLQLYVLYIAAALLVLLVWRLS